MIKDEYIKSLDALKKIQKICEDNDFCNKDSKTWELKNINDKVNDLLEKVEKLNKYKELDTDCDVFGKLNFVGNCGIWFIKEILNVGKIEPETLLCIEFPTGAYLFGDDYDVEYFHEFYKELKDVQPKYEDELNHKLYYSFKDDVAFTAYKHYKDTLSKYIERYKERKKTRRIEMLKDELKRLEDDEQKCKNINQ